MLIHEGLMVDSFEQEIASRHQAVHLIFLLQDDSKLFLSTDAG